MLLVKLGRKKGSAAPPSSASSLAAPTVVELVQADLIAYLASDRAAAIHGAEVVIDGGTVRTV